MVQVVVAGAVTGVLLIWENIETCATVDGSAKSKSECGRDVFASVAGVGLSALRYHRTQNAHKREDIDLASMTTGLTEALEQSIPGALVSNANTTKVGSLSIEHEGYSNEMYEYFNSQGIPIVHVKMSHMNDKRSECEKINGTDICRTPNELDFFLASPNDGVFHFIPDNSGSKQKKRYGFTGYDLLKGALTIYGNSDSVATWDDARTWAGALMLDPDNLYMYLPEKLQK